MSIDVIAQEVKEENPSEILSGMNAYFEEQGKPQVYTLDDVVCLHATISLSRIIGFKESNQQSMREALVLHEVLSENLEDYDDDTVERISRKVIDSLSHPWHSHYFTVSDEDVLRKNRKRFVQTKAFHDYLNNQNIKSLVDVRYQHASVSLAAVLGFKKTSSPDMVKKLVELGVFSEDLRDYSAIEIENIARTVIKKISFPTKAFDYHKVADVRLAHINRQLLLNTQTFREYVDELAITSLDDITGKHASDGMASLLGCKRNCPEQYRDKLDEFGILPYDLSRYDPERIEEIAAKIIQDVSKTGAKSVYIMHKDTRDNNRRIIFKTKAFEDYFAGLNLASLDDIDKRHTIASHTTLFGFQVGRISDLRDKLDEFGILTKDLSSYPLESLEKIASHAVSHVPGKKASAYFNPKNNNSLENNRRVLCKTKALHSYLVSIGVQSLDHIQGKAHASARLGSLLGFDAGQVKKSRERLLELGALSENLEEYETLTIENVARVLIDKLVSQTWQSHYLNRSSNKETNRAVILGTRCVQNWLAKEGVDLSNFEKTATPKVKLFFKRYFDGGPTVYQPNYRRINAAWNQDEESLLLEYAGNFDSAEKLLACITQDKDTLQELYGRSILAIKGKLEQMGLLIIGESEGVRKSRIEGINFPPVHREEFNDVDILYKNVAAILEGNQPISFAPAIGYDSASHQKFTHVTLPIFYKGCEIDNYSDSEKELILGMSSYINDASAFTQAEGESEIKLDQECVHTPKILRVKGDNEYIQLLAKLPNKSKTDTAVIGIKKINVYYFKQDNVTFAGTRDM